MANSPIDLLDESTWPQPVVDVVQQEIEPVLERIRAGARLGALDRQLRTPRVRRQGFAGQYQAAIDESRVAIIAWEAAVERVAVVISDYDIRGHHATRLHRDEVEAVKRDGMRPLSGASLRERVARRAAAGDLSARVAQIIEAEHLGDQDIRTGMIWFVFDGDLTNHGFLNLLSSWGGEAIYGCTDDAEAQATFSRLGVPCFIEASVPIRALSDRFTLAEKMINVVLHRRRIVRRQPDHECYINEALPAERVLKIIEFGTAEFAERAGPDTCADLTR
jgi:hypothetical protein